MPESIGHLMLDDQFIKNCMEVFSVPSRCSETNLRAFPQKHLNIIDPLKENNNLGRSVHKGNFYRIRSAFKYGARKLGQILLLPRERVRDETRKFFANTLERHGRKYGAYLQTSALAFDAEVSWNLSSISHAETLSEDVVHIKSFNIDFDKGISGSEQYCNSLNGNGLERCAMRADSSHVLSESGWFEDGTAISGSCLGGDANDYAATRLVNLRGPHETLDTSPPSSNHSSSQSEQYNRTLKCYTSRSRVVNGNFHPRKPGESFDDNVGCNSWLENGDKNLMAANIACACDNNHEGLSCCGSAISSPVADISENLSLDFREGSLVAIAEDTEALNPLSDLSGDYDSHLRSLLYGQGCHGYALSALVLSNPPAPHSEVQKQQPWDIVRQSMPIKRTSSSDVNTNGLVLGPPMNPAANSRAVVAAFGSEERCELQGTGTFISSKNGCSCKGKSSQGRVRKIAPGNHGKQQRRAQKNGADPALAEKNGEGSHDPPHTWSSGYGKPELSCQSHDTMDDNGHHADGFSDPSWRLEFGSLGYLPTSCSHFASSTSQVWGSTPNLALSEEENSKPLPVKRQERILDQSYRLKNEDFPPLSH